MNTPLWTKNAVFYHIYPLGLTGAPYENDFYQQPVPRLEQLYPWLDHLAWIGANAIYLGPVFESGSHGYDTCDFYRIDRRLGDNQTMKRFAREVHQRGMRLVLDGVFNHVGRAFWAFRDVQMHKERSAYRDWFSGLRFDRTNPYGDPFDYQTWDGHYSLPKLNLENPAVRDHLLDAVRMWIDEWKIDGLRLDAADHVLPDFWQHLRSAVHERNPDFWLMGEVVHGDYRQWINESMMDSVTNYEAYKGLFSSLNDGNYHEIAYSLNRQFGSSGIYKNLSLYNFCDNHDVNRIASQLHNPAQLVPLYALLFSMPGIPSIYYGSEWGVGGIRTEKSDRDLRPALELPYYIEHAPQPALPEAIRKLASIRSLYDCLRHGSYQEILVRSEQFIFKRQQRDQAVLVALNAAEQDVLLENLPLEGFNKVKMIYPHEESARHASGSFNIHIPAYQAVFLELIA